MDVHEWLNKGYEIWIWMLDHLIVINFIFSILIVFFQRREPKLVWTWLVVLNFIPIFGFLLYLVFGQNLYKMRMFQIKEIEDKLNFIMRTQKESFWKENYLKEVDRQNRFSDLFLYNLEVAGAVYTQKNKVKVFIEGNDKFDTLLKDIENAKHYIHLQYYIIRDDEVFRKISALLIQKAKQGVIIRILYDSLGSVVMPKRVWKRLKKEGIKVGEFFPATFKRFHFRINYRNHRKIVIIDGKIAYVGGINIGREYISKNEKYGHWRDTHMRLEGACVVSLQLLFSLDWNYTTRENLFATLDYFSEQIPSDVSHIPVQIISSGPDSCYCVIRDNYLRMIHKAAKSIYIQTPYFIPDEAILSALKIAIKSGVDVQLMIPSKPDHPFVYWATYSYMGELLEEGARCYIYEKGFLHVKGMMVDQEICCFGTANMDIRSFELNFEVNALIHNREITQEMEGYFQKDKEDSREITKFVYSKRPLLIRFKEQCCRLLSPLL
ncbi:major cardiolipin synthase ClsA [Clostridia bacterium]|nr:major cardiolipin synthase ClsA [Clostridia bacterium]